jgi:hypothetical protein
MNLNELITVTERWHLEPLGLVLHPDFPEPVGWKDRDATITVRVPGGIEFQTEALLRSCHLNIRDPAVHISKRWRVVICLPNACADEVPIGSLLLAPADISDCLKVCETESRGLPPIRPNPA